MESGVTLCLWKLRIESTPRIKVRIAIDGVRGDACECHRSMVGRSARRGSICSSGGKDKVTVDDATSRTDIFAAIWQAGL